MKKKIFALLVSLFFIAQVGYAAPSKMGGGPGGARPMGHAMGHSAQMRGPGGMHRPPSHRPAHLGIRPIPGARPPMHHIAAHPPIHRPHYRPYRPLHFYPIGLSPYLYSSLYYPYSYYSTTYYPVTEYEYEEVVPVSSTVNTVVVRDNYAGINTAANVLNAAANVASTIKFLTW